MLFQFHADYLSDYYPNLNSQKNSWIVKSHWSSIFGTKKLSDLKISAAEAVSFR